MTLYQVLRHPQAVLAVILGTCPLRRQPVTLDRLRLRLRLRRNLTKNYKASAS
jgi:hypothetical protein